MKIYRLEEIPLEQRNGYVIKRIFTEPLSCNPENIGLYQTIIPPGSRVNKHLHKNLDEILFFLTKGKVETDSGIFSLNPGDFVVLSPGDEHEIIAEDKEVRLIAVKIPNIIHDRIEE